jgi:hypothetical protein
MEEGKLTTAARQRQTDALKLIHVIRGDLDWIVMKALEKDRTRRYETANGLARDVERHLNNEPVVARPPSMGYRFQKLVRRNKLVFATGGAVVLALVAGLALSTWSLLHERQANANAHHLLYVADMNMAGQAWDQNNIGRPVQILDETKAFPDRGFEWYYWMRQTHLCLKTFLRAGGGRVDIAVFSPDGQRIITGTKGFRGKLWDAAGGQALRTFDSLYCTGFSPDSQRMVTCMKDGTAKVWETTNANPLLSIPLNNTREWVFSVAFSPDGRRIATDSAGQSAKVWETASGRELLTLKGHVGGVLSVAFSPDGQRIVTGSDDGTAKVWEGSRTEEAAQWKAEESAPDQH